MLAPILTQRREQRFHIGWPLRFDRDRLAGLRMQEFEPLRMQGLAPECAQRGNKFHTGALWQLEQAAILRVTDQRMTHMRHVHADLVRPSSLKTTLDQGHRAEALTYPVVRNRVATVIAHGLFQAIVQMATDRRIDAAARNHRAIHDRGVLAMHGASLAVMESDAKRMRGERPFVFTNLKSGDGVARVVEFIVERGMLEAR